MSNLSGYDSEAVGFTSVTRSKRPETSTSTQTSEFSETGTGCQTTVSRDTGCSVTPEDVIDTPQYSPRKLNEFLKRVVPTMLEQIEENDREREVLYNSSESDEEEALTARLFQEIDLKPESSMASGDQQTPSILSVSWSSAGHSVAASLGHAQHEDWCGHDGLIKIFTIKRTAGDKLVHSLDINERNCVSVVKYHHSLAALLAYGTVSGEVVIVNLRDAPAFGDVQLATPAGCHGSRRVAALQWADAGLATAYLTLQVARTGRRRAASDQVLVSAGSDGTLNVWQVNSNFKVFENIVSYAINGSKRLSAPDITCFDHVKAGPLRPSDEKVPDDVFVVGAKSGKLYLCSMKKGAGAGGAVDPVSEVLDGHAACVLDVAFGLQRPQLFASLSIDSELRLYDIHQHGPLMVICLEMTVSCVSWLAGAACAVVGGAGGGRLRVYHVRSGRELPAPGLAVAGTVTALGVTHGGTCRVAAGDEHCKLRLWELPARRGALPLDDEF